MDEDDIFLQSQPWAVLMFRYGKRAGNQKFKLLISLGGKKKKKKKKFF